MRNGGILPWRAGGLETRRMAGRSSTLTHSRPPTYNDNLGHTQPESLGYAEHLLLQVLFLLRLNNRRVQMKPACKKNQCVKKPATTEDHHFEHFSAGHIKFLSRGIQHQNLKEEKRRITKSHNNTIISPKICFSGNTWS